jgi:integrase
VNAHLYRHIGGFLYLEARPDGIETVSVMLGHKHLETTRRFYARLRETKAMQLFMQVVFGKRDDMIDKLKLGWGRMKK